MYDDYRLPVSGKGVLLDGDRAVLLKNHRGEWEPPGGRLEVGENPEECVAREMMEELGVPVFVERILDSWVYEALPSNYVLIVTYGCFAKETFDLRHSLEHEAVGLFGVEDLPRVKVPEGYRNSVRAWIEWPNNETSS